MSTDIIVRKHESGALEVLVGERTTGTMTWGEVIEQITSLTYPRDAPSCGRYPMKTPEEWRERWGGIAEAGDR
jgi:hypothetical protein